MKERARGSSHCENVDDAKTDDVREDDVDTLDSRSQFSLVYLTAEVYRTIGLPLPGTYHIPIPFVDVYKKEGIMLKKVSTLPVDRQDSVRQLLKNETPVYRNQLCRCPFPTN